MYGLSAGVWTEKGSRILWMAERLRAGVVWANTFNRFDPTSPFGGYKESGFGREGGRHGLEAYLRFERACDDRLPAGPQDVQALHRRCVPALRVGPHARARGAERRARLAQGRARRRRRGAQGVPGVERRDRRTTAARCSTGSPRRWRRALGDLAGVCSGRREVERAIDRVVWYAGWADKLRAGARRRRTRSPARTSTSPCPSRPASSRSSHPTSRALDGLVARIVPALVGGNAVVVVASETHPLAAIELAEAVATSDVPGGVVNLLTGLPRRARAGARRAHGRQRDRRHRAPTATRRRSRCSRPRTSSASSGRARSGARGRSRAFLELKTVWHPVGALSCAHGDALPGHPNPPPTVDSIALVACVGDVSVPTSRRLRDVGARLWRDGEQAVDRRRAPPRAAPPAGPSTRSHGAPLARRAST